MRKLSMAELRMAGLGMAELSMDGQGMVWLGTPGFFYQLIHMKYSIKKKMYK